MSTEAPEHLIRWNYLWYAGAAFAVMFAAIMSHDLWFLNFIHVFFGLLWTGIDLFMGFVLGPILRRVDLSVRRVNNGEATPISRMSAHTVIRMTRSRGSASGSVLFFATVISPKKTRW